MRKSRSSGRRFQGRGCKPMEEKEKRVNCWALWVGFTKAKPNICGVTGYDLRLEADGAGAMIAAKGDSAPI